MTRAQMPRLVEGSAPGGMLRRELAREWGMRGGRGGGRRRRRQRGQRRSAWAWSAAGDGFISLGTSGVFFAGERRATVRTRRKAVHTFCHALPGQWHQMGVMLSAASCLRWVTQLTHAADEAELLGRG